MNRLGLFLGTLFGFFIAGSGLNDYDVIHNALLFRDAYVFLMMGSAIAVALPGLWLLERSGWKTPMDGKVLNLSPVPVERKHILGATTFGLGWALTGSCPGPALAMVAGGGVLGLLPMLGLFVGILLHNEVAARQQCPAPEPTTAEPAPTGG